MLNEKTEQFRFLILKLQVLNRKGIGKTAKLPDNGNMRKIMIATADRGGGG